ncbi:MAG: GNAT family N-acetyltransferase, partial [Verrucomicrobia bacterium]|nr:GNAT family N-acetyltransferase [Verrucomicrobiota bacterium]
MAVKTTVTLLLDTNIFIPLEPTATSGVEPGSEQAAQLIRSCSTAGVQVFLHPLIAEDIDSDRNEHRRALRHTLATKYLTLPSPPSLSAEIVDIFGEPERQHNDHVDLHLLAALQADAVSLLVTEDRGIHAKARKLGLGERVALVCDALDTVERLFSQHPVPPPAVSLCYAHELDSTDPAFSSLRDDYEGFDAWLSRCKQSQRRVWTVRQFGSNQLAGFCIVKDESPPEHGMAGKVVKMCCFKISSAARGKGYGELLLKAVFGYAMENGADWVYTTVLPKHEFLLDYLGALGFMCDQKIADGTEILARKAMKPGLVSDDERLSHLDFHIRYGPAAARLARVAKFCVPIQPRFASILFPESERQVSFLDGEYSFGNSIRKAYLCHAGIRELPPGSFLAFYRSRKRRGLFAFGV